MKTKRRFITGKSARARKTAPAKTPCDKMRAVAFRIEDKVYEGSSKATHLTLYTTLLVAKLVPAHTLDIWTSDEKNHGFVTEKGEFLDRLEVFRRFGASQSQELRAKGSFKTARESRTRA